MSKFCFRFFVPKISGHLDTFPPKVPKMDLGGRIFICFLAWPLRRAQNLKPLRRNCFGGSGSPSSVHPNLPFHQTCRTRAPCRAPSSCAGRVPCDAGPAPTAEAPASTAAQETLERVVDVLRELLYTPTRRQPPPPGLECKEFKVGASLECVLFFLKHQGLHDGMKLISVQNISVIYFLQIYRFCKFVYVLKVPPAHCSPDCPSPCRAGMPCFCIACPLVAREGGWVWAWVMGCHQPLLTASFSGEDQSDLPINGLLGDAEPRNAL